MYNEPNVSGRARSSVLRRRASFVLGSEHATLHCEDHLLADAASARFRVMAGANRSASPEEEVSVLIETCLHDKHKDNTLVLPLSITRLHLSIAFS